MPLYRTVSDRGLWKKKQTKEVGIWSLNFHAFSSICLQTSFSTLFPQDPAPQHFHKPNYIDKSRPQITYSQVCIFSRKHGLLVNLIMFLTNCSQLNLGQGYRYNSKQSIPDINKDIDDANRRLGKPLFEMCCFHMGIAHEGGLPGWFWALFPHICPGL